MPEALGLGDEEVLGLAASESRILVTRNARDFERIARRWASTSRDHAGILLIWTRETDEFGSLVRAIDRQLDELPDPDEWRNLVLAI
jgi:hypothetical protein